jgi:hypothetical protein
VYKTTPEMRTPLLIRTLQAVPRLSAIVGIIICKELDPNKSLQAIPRVHIGVPLYVTTAEI